MEGSFGWLKRLFWVYGEFLNGMKNYWEWPILCKGGVGEKFN